MQADVEHLAHLARLDLTDEEKKTYQTQLTDILEYFEMLQEIDVADIPPTATVLPKDTVLRGDVVEESLDRDDLLQNLDDEDREGGMFRVKAVIE